MLDTAIHILLTLSGSPYENILAIDIRGLEGWLGFFGLVGFLFLCAFFLVPLLIFLFFMAMFAACLSDRMCADKAEKLATLLGFYGWALITKTVAAASFPYETGVAIYIVAVFLVAHMICCHLDLRRQNPDNSSKKSP